MSKKKGTWQKNRVNKRDGLQSKKDFPGALGYTLQLPTEERYLVTKRELFAKIDVLLGGRAAEELVFTDISTGAADDLSKATDIVRKMLTEYGMSEKFRNVYLSESRGKTYIGHQSGPSSREYSEATQQYIDDETARLISDRYGRVKKTIEEHREILVELAERLIKKEVLDGKEFEDIIMDREEKQQEGIR